MSPDNIVSLTVFLWLIAIYGILAFMRFAHPYREDPEEQKRENREQERALRAFTLRRERRKKRSRM
jgi:hypothetical protein